MKLIRNISTAVILALVAALCFSTFYQYRSGAGVEAEAADGKRQKACRILKTRRTMSLSNWALNWSPSRSM